MLAVRDAPQAPRIYNLFPRLAGKLPDWVPHLERAAGMNFNWVFLNPIHLTGGSGSLYSIKDYYRIDPAIVDGRGASAEEQLRRVIEEGGRLGLKFMVDLVINHTATDSPLVGQHPGWYQHDERGNLRHPGAWDNGNWVSWGDLAEIDNSSSAERKSLWDYWDQLTAHYQGLGFAGFRCDAAYQVPPGLWRFLIKRARARGEAAFFAETLGCSLEETIATARAGFDYIFNSFKWWDLGQPWFLDQYRRTARVVPSVAFPESHDTERLYPSGGEVLLRQRYLIAAAISAGVMMPVGYEFGFRKKLHVVRTRAKDWEKPAADLRDFVAKVNAAKAARAILNVDSPPRILSQANPAVVCLLRKHEAERLLICVNKDLGAGQQVRLSLEKVFGKEARPRDVLEPGRAVALRWKEKLGPGEARLIHAAAG
jgi:starch synthase (maltosyl-transferring)